MTSTNRVALGYVRGVTAGVVPASPRFRGIRFVSESLSFTPEYIDSDEIRDDRMMGDPILSMKSAAGGINTEFSYPLTSTFQSDALRSLLWADWLNFPSRDNDGVADSVITDIGTVADTITFTGTGGTFLVNHIIRTSGFANAANNGTFIVTTGGTTSLVATAATFVAEAVPPGAARVKAVGIQGAAGDLATVSDGITSVALNFTTLGLTVGQWINIGGSATANRFTTTAVNNFARITAITATKLTLDNLPAGWAADTGAGKNIRLFFGDVLRNGTTRTELHIEKAFRGQTSPSYLTYLAQTANTCEISIASKAKVTANYGFIGLGGNAATTTLDASYDEPSTNAVMGANANVGRLAENNAILASPNWARSLTISVNNNMRVIDALDAQVPVDTREGEFAVTGRVEMYFGNLTLLNKFYAGTPTSLNSRIAKNNQAVIFTLPRVTYRSDGSPQAGGKNQDVMLPLGYQASRDPLTECHLQIDRFEYYEI